MNTAAKIRQEIIQIELEVQSNCRRIGAWFADNDNDAYSIIWPAWARKLARENERMAEVRRAAERRLAEAEASEIRAAEIKARREQEERQRDFDARIAEIKAADSRSLWEAVNAARAAAGCPKLGEGTIGSEHVRRQAFSLGVPV